MQVVFTEVRWEGDRELGRIRFSRGQMEIDPAVKNFADTLLRGVNREAQQEVRAALEQAPYRFDGAYVRAKFLES